MAGAERRPRCPGHSLPAGHRRPRALRGLQVRRPGAARRALRDHRGGVRHVESWRGTRPRGAADSHRERARSSGGTPGQAGRTTDGRGGHRCRRELRGHRHPLGIAPGRRLPPHGDGRARRPHDGDRADPRPPCRRCGFTDLRRAQQSDRIRGVLTTVVLHPPRRVAHRRRVPVGGRHRRGRRGHRHGSLQTGRHPPAPGRTKQGAAHAGGWPGRRRTGHRVRRRNGPKLVRGVVLGADRAAIPRPAGGRLDRGRACCCCSSARVWPMRSR